jgi:radical SAM protein with 4Fe4S-binding SPASM domain
LQAFKGNGGKSVTMSGGEVMQFKGFPELVEYAHHLGLETLIYTNGILWNESLIKRLAPCISSVQVSIDGYNEETNAVVRGKHNFDKACDAVVAFVRHGVEVKVATTFIFDNITNDIESKYKRFTESLNRRAGKELEYHLTKSLIKGRDVNYTKEQNKQIAELMMSVQDTISPNSEYANFIEGHDPNILEKSCGYGKLTIDSNGDVYLCSTIEVLKPIGNVLEESMAQLLHKAESYSVLSDVEHLEECKGCELRYVCNGGCRLENGVIKDHVFKHDKCTEEFKSQLLKQMKDSFIYYYNI